MHGHFNDQYPCTPTPTKPPEYCFNPAPPCPPPPCTPGSSPPEFPGMCPPPHPPHPPLMPPAPSVVEGQSLYQAFNCLNDRVNICINTYNQVMQNGYKVLRDMQRAAEVNGAYYTKGEVWTEEGYSAEESAVYTIIHKANLDKKGNPIRMELHLGYNNTTNSKVPQNIFSASQITFADKMVVAQPMGVDGWYGNVIYKGTPLPHADRPTLYTMGWTRSGVMKVYNNSVDPDQMLCDTIENAMGVSGVLIQNGEILNSEWYNQIPDYDKQVSRICIGQNMQTREVIIICCGATNGINRKGMTSLACANILRQYGCSIAVEVMEGANTGASDKGRLLFDPPGDDVPEAYAYWFISRKCHYHNDFQNEIGKLTQIYGEQLWRTHLAENKVNGFDDRLKQEIADRELGDQALDTKIEAETSRAEAAEQHLQDQIDAIDTDAIEADLQAEIDRAKAAEAALDKKIDDTKADLQEEIDQDVEAEKTRAEAAEQQLQENITAEQRRAEAAESQLQTNITAEQNRAESAEQLLQNNINAEQQRAQQAESDLQNKITLETERATQAESTLDQKYSNEVSKINTLYQTLTQQVTSMDTAVTEMQKTINEIEITLNNMKELISESQTLVREVQNLLEEIKNGTADIPYVKLAGDTMTGNLHMGAAVSGNSQMVLFQTSGDEIGLQGVANAETPTIRLYDTTHTSKKVVLTNLETPTNPADAVPKSYLDEQIEDIVSGDVPLNYVKKTGDTMTGSLTVQRDITIGGGSGPIPMGGYNLRLKGEAGPEVQIQAVNGQISLSSGSGGAVPGTPRITNLGQPINANDAATKRYVEAEADTALNDAKAYTDNEFSGLEAMLDTYYPKAGGDLAGNVNFTAASANATNSRTLFFNFGPNLSAPVAGITTHLDSAGSPFVSIGSGDFNVNLGTYANRAEIRGLGSANTGSSAVSRDTADERYLAKKGGNNGVATGNLSIEGASSVGFKLVSTNKEVNSPSLLFRNLAPDATTKDVESQYKTAFTLLRAIQKTKAEVPLLYVYSRLFSNGVQVGGDRRTQIGGVAVPTLPNQAVPLDYLEQYVQSHSGKMFISQTYKAFLISPNENKSVKAETPVFPTGTTTSDWSLMYSLYHISAELANDTDIEHTYCTSSWGSQGNYIYCVGQPTNPTVSAFDLKGGTGLNVQRTAWLSVIYYYEHV